MIHLGRLYRAELYDRCTYPYANVKAVYDAHKDKHPGKRLVVTNAHWHDPGPKYCGNYKVRGKTLSAQWPGALWGFGWSEGERPFMLRDMATVDNFISTIAAFVAGVRQDVSAHGSGVQRATARTWWGFRADGLCAVEVTEAGYTLAGILDRMAKLGVADGLVLDGSGSSQWYDGETHIQGDGRTVYSYLLLWFDDKGEDDMTETNLRNKVVQTALGWLGSREGTDAHKAIIDLYNSHKPLARSYPVKYTDEWCAAFVSAVAIKCGLTDIMPTECGVERMARLYQALGRWEENDAYIPQPGDVLMYDWQAKATGDTTGWADHVGIVEKVEGNTIHVIEGNKNNAVTRVTVPVDYRYIRGFGLPDYASKATEADKPVEKTEKELAREWVMARGVSDGERPDDPVKRSELWRMLYRMEQEVHTK